MKTVFQISIGEEKNYYIKIESGVFSTGEDKVENPNVTIRMNPSIASDIFAGTINASSAYMTKELQFEGSMMLGMKFKQITDAVSKDLDL